MRTLLGFLLVTLTITIHAAETQLVPPRAIWKYLDNGTNQGTAWREHGFNDASWPSGPAELGYGDGDEATVVGYGPDAAHKYPTTYFRRTFNVADPAAFASLNMRLVRDDGAIVYINGTEVWRNNMSATGTIGYATLAYGSVSSSTDERTFITKSISASVLQAGVNTVAVEIHQNDAASSDISFDFELLGDTTPPTPLLLRGPYLQLGTPTSVTVRWRTDNPSDSYVRYGTRVGSLTSQAVVSTPTTEHSVTLTGLTAGTRYYYSIGSSTKVLAGDDASHTFLTAPSSGTATPARIWVLGDAGTGGTGALAVRNAYYDYAGGTTNTHLWLMLGDNAYSSGTDVDYESGVFRMYPEMLRSSVLWPAIGNHDTAESTTHSLSYPYYDIFTLPTQGEAGGVASGTESYYSFDYGNVHFVVLDGQTSDRSPTGPMLTWLRNDLAANFQHWTIALVHQPPYSHGSHNSDTSLHLVEMRQNALPILEEAGVDLVLAGHSHAYERSFLLDSHYGKSTTLNNTMVKDGGDGSETGTGAYRKANAGPHEGAVYVVSGAAGKVVSGALDHPVMVSNYNSLGSTILDVSADRIDVKFLRDTGVIADSFTIIKGAVAQPPAAPASLTATTQSASSIALSWIDNATDEDGYRVTRCGGAACTDFTLVTQLAANATTYVDASVVEATEYRYRVIAYSATRGESYSNIAEATTPQSAPPVLTATAQSPSSVALSWTGNADRVSRCSGAGCTSFVQVAQVTGNAYTDSNLGPSTVYRYHVAFGTFQPSNVAEATTPAAANPPAAPNALSAKAQSTTSILLKWVDNATDETGHRITRCAGASCADFVEVALTGANATSYLDTNLTPATLYRYRVYAYNNAGSSARSNTAEASTANPLTPPAAPTSLTTTGAGMQVNLAWADNAVNETGYTLERCIGDTCTNFAALATLGADVRAYNDSAVLPGTTYRYRVRAFNDGGVSAYSNISAERLPSQ
ncbi:MAG TPA: fibronectin type III domain-containing protein [Thermoanaerobaculia bacterium]|nr:fibronectin type III domain-containing protein [Thermoanaerobaculia bacterium]